MNLDGFSSYDLIADIVPGTVLVVFAVSVAPGDLRRALTAGDDSLYAFLVLVAAAFVAGRFVHSVGSVIADKRNREEEQHVEDILQKPRSEAVTRNAWKNAHATLGSPSIEQMRNPTAIRKRGESLLYGRNSLYRKYETISTFYRGMVVSYSIGFLLFSAFIIGEYLGSELLSGAPATTTGIEWIILLTASQVTLAYVSYRRWCHWNERKAPAFINDLASLPPSDAERR